MARVLVDHQQHGDMPLVGDRSQDQVLADEQALQAAGQQRRKLRHVIR